MTENFSKSSKMDYTEKKEVDAHNTPEQRFSSSSIFKIDQCINFMKNSNRNKSSENYLTNKLNEIENLSEFSDQSSDFQPLKTPIQINCNIPKLNEIIPIPIEETSLKKICYTETLVISSKNDANELFDFKNLKEVGKLYCTIENTEDVLISFVKSNLNDKENDFLDFISFDAKNSIDSINYSKQSGEILNIFPSSSFILLARYLIITQIN